jgi:hypothetical protein
LQDGAAFHANDVAFSSIVYGLAAAKIADLVGHDCGKKMDNGGRLPFYAFPNIGFRVPMHDSRSIENRRQATELDVEHGPGI